MGEKVDILLIKEWGESKYGDIISVGYGLYDTMIRRKLGVPISYSEGIKDKKRIVIECSQLTKDNDKLREENVSLWQKLSEAQEKIKELKSGIDTTEYIEMDEYDD